MITNNYIEIQKDSTYTFTIFKENQNTSVIPSTALITITDSAGTQLLASTAMTINATTGVCTYAWDSTGVATGLNYIVKYNLDSDNTITRLFDIYLYPFTNLVTDDDLLLEYEDIKTGAWEASNTSQSGSTSTLVDNNRYEDDNYWKGGIIEIYQDNKSYVRQVISFVSSTNTITFSPVLDVAILTDKYIIRKSYQSQITYAGNKVCLDYKKINKRASLIIDSNTVKYLIIYKFFSEFFFKLIKSSEDEYSIKYDYYSNKYKTEFESLSLVYDADGDSVIDDGEENEKIGQIKWYR